MMIFVFWYEEIVECIIIIIEYFNRNIFFFRFFDRIFGNIYMMKELFLILRKFGVVLSVS